MQTLAPVTGYAPAASGITLFARILGDQGVPITAATLTSIAYTVTDLSDGTQLAAGVSVPTSAITNSLIQNDSRWTEDSATAPGPDRQWGYNFLCTVPATNMPPITLAPTSPEGWTNPPPAYKDVQIDVRFTPVADQPFAVPYKVRVMPVFG